jgi:hypothetical protein
MNAENILIIVAIIVIVGLLAFILFRPKTTSPPPAPEVHGPSTVLQLQAYERLIILAERIGLRHLLGGIPNEGLSARQYQATLVEAIKREYEYNISQQIYVSPKAWEAVQNLKEQNIFVINQLSGYIGPEATAKDLSRAIAEYLTGNEHASLQQIVTEALTYEAKKLMH